MLLYSICRDSCPGHLHSSAAFKPASFQVSNWWWEKWQKKTQNSGATLYLLHLMAVVYSKMNLPEAHGARFCRKVAWQLLLVLGIRHTPICLRDTDLTTTTHVTGGRGGRAWYRMRSTLWAHVAQLKEVPSVACTLYKVLGSDFPLRPTKSSIPPRSVNSYQSHLGRIKHLLLHRLVTTNHCRGQKHIHIACTPCRSRMCDAS